MIEELFQTNCIKIGNYKLKNGDYSKYYFNMKNLISYPQLLKRIGDDLYKKLPEFDIICGVPYGGLPIASYISTTYNKPLIFVRDKTKGYGMQKRIEGEYERNNRCIIIDDVMTTGGSIKEVKEVLINEVEIVDIAVVFNRQESDMDVKFLYCKNDVVKYRLRKIKIKKNSNLIFSADLEDPQKIIDILENHGEKIVVCKIHLDILDLDNYENNFIEEIIKLSIKHDFLIMEDRKFIDISYIVEKQYKKFKNWVDLVTVHSLVSSETLSKFSGALLITSMTTLEYSLETKALELIKSNRNNVAGFITQKRIREQDLFCMTPGISLEEKKEADQKYRNYKNVDTDFIIVGRAIYNSLNIEETIKTLLN